MGGVAEMEWCATLRGWVGYSREGFPWALVWCKRWVLSRV